MVIIQAILRLDYSSQSLSQPTEFERYPQRQYAISLLHLRSMSSGRNSGEAAAAGPVGSTQAPLETSSKLSSSLEYSKPFSDLKNLQPETMEAIQSTFGHEYMSKVQDRVLSTLPTKRDLLVKAKTGTGKTLAFLVAALESLMASPSSSSSSSGGRTGGSVFKMEGKIGCVIVAPTRELALQISDEAQKLLNPLGWGVQYLVGGESKSGQLDRISKEAAEFVVATPGRLKDLLENPDFAAKILESRVLVLDEADTMLQLGFREELECILRAMPQDRQTFLFSATIDSKLDSLLEVALHRDVKDQNGPVMIDTVGENEINLNLATLQRFCLAPYQSHVALVRRIINDHLLRDMDFEHEQSLKKPKTSSLPTSGKTRSASTTANWALPSSKDTSRDTNNKIMVFLPTTRGAQLYAKVFSRLSMGKELSVFEIHSAKDQRERTSTSRNFRNIRTPAVLFTSDVSARGVDYPGVGLVIQVGAPLSLDHYIHRIGRTGRGNGKDLKDNAGESSHGKGILILGELDQGFIEHQLKPSPLSTVIEQEHKYDDWESVMLGENLDRGYKRAISKVDERLAKSAYTAFLGYNLTVGPRIGNTDRKKILESADKYIAAFGVEERPAISISFLERMGFMKHRIPAIENGEEEIIRQPHEYELVDGTFPTINTRITKSPYASTTSSTDDDEEDIGMESRTGKKKYDDDQPRFSRKKRQEAFEEEIGLADIEYIKINEEEWEDFIEFKPGMPKLIERLHNPKRLGHIGNRPSKKLAKIYSHNDGW
ncbi:hypothetical protein BGX21_010477 [Mortierella sp. AD011]|nr:hypothetical protein BGX20_010419 [Mortierella sp. AD010]KAF9394119.1 hypothetical protein BGX21_010477 [Mortierella sp. AD011]